jgi:mannose-6-phosphate isomerase-like protein (cupin superfamily)
MLDAGLATRTHRPLAELVAQAEPAPGEAIRVVEVGRDADASHHLVGLRASETPHRHDRHDLLVVILRGHGHMRQGEQTLPVGEGSIVYVPRGRVHAFTNASQTPAVAYVVYHPPYDGEDQVPAE